MANSGRFIPRHPEKYIGDANKIFFRSSWEMTCMKFFDSRSDIVEWNSEEISIPYLSPADGRVHRYFPDFVIKYINREGKELCEVVEVKPLHESESKFAKSDRSKDALEVNEAKWAAASLYCEEHGMKFRVLTEKSIFHQGVKKTRKKKAE
jgi:hypothetical protein